MKIVEKKLSELVPFPTNPRNNDKAVEAVKNSIRDFGFRNPVIINSDNVILAGHTRHKAAQKLGLETIPCIVVNNMSTEQEKAFRLADNKVAEKALWDFEKLTEEIDEIEQDLTLYGIERPDVSEIDLESWLGEKKEKNIICPHCGKEIVR